METIRTRAEQEARRRLAVTRVGEGWPPADTAAFLGVHVETVRKWVRAHKAGGDGGLAGTPHPGRKPFLTPEQEAEALGWLTRKPTAFGFRTDLWTAARVNACRRGVPGLMKAALGMCSPISSISIWLLFAVP